MPLSRRWATSTAVVAHDHHAGTGPQHEIGADLLTDAPQRGALEPHRATMLPRASSCAASAQVWGSVPYTAPVARPAGAPRRTSPDFRRLHVPRPAQEGGPLEVTFGSFENTWLWIVLAISLVALAFAWYLRAKVLAEPEGSDKDARDRDRDPGGAKAYLRRQFSTLGVFLGILTVALFFVLPVSDAVTTSLLGLSPELTIRFGRSLAFLPARRRGLDAHGVRGHVARGARQRAHRQRREGIWPAQGARSRSAPVGWPACSPSASACSARR